jgi:hypothetical protein
MVVSKCDLEGTREPFAPEDEVIMGGYKGPLKPAVIKPKNVSKVSKRKSPLERVATRCAEPNDDDFKLADKWATWITNKMPWRAPDNVRIYAEAIHNVRQKYNLNVFGFEKMFDHLQQDSFWSKNCLSPITLDAKCKDGLTKLDHILLEMQRQMEPKKKKQITDDQLNDIISKMK